jgi:hypothetical protein
VINVGVVPEPSTWAMLALVSWPIAGSQGQH